MNNFERNIYEKLFAQKIDFFTRSINDVVIPSRSQKSTKVLEEELVADKLNINAPLDVNEEEQPSSSIQPPKQLNKKSKKIIAFIVALLFVITAAIIYFLYTTTSDTDQIVLYRVNSETGKRINNIKYFIDSDKKGYIVTNKQTNVQTTLDEFIKNFDRSELDLDVNTIPYINLVSDDLKQQFQQNQGTINNWLKLIGEIHFQEKTYIDDFNLAKSKITTSEQNSSLIDFYKSHGVFDKVVESNKIYKNNKEVFETIGDISLSDKNLTSLSFDHISPSQFINYDELIKNVKSETSEKYHNQKLISSGDVKVVTETELKDFDQKLENTSSVEVSQKYGLNVNKTNMESFAQDFEKLKDELRKITNVKRIVDNDLNKSIQEQKFVDRVKDLFNKFDHNVDQKYCLAWIKTSLDKQNLTKEAKDIALTNVDQTCNDLANAHEKHNPQISIDATGVVSSTSSRMYQGQDNSNEVITLINFDSTKSAKKYLEDYTNKVEQIKNEKHTEFSLSSILYNDSNMIVLIPNGINDEIRNYLGQVQITNWNYFDYYEQVKK